MVIECVREQWGNCFCLIAYTAKPNRGVHDGLSDMTSKVLWPWLVWKGFSSNSVSVSPMVGWLAA